MKAKLPKIDLDFIGSSASKVAAGLLFALTWVVFYSVLSRNLPLVKLPPLIGSDEYAGYLLVAITWLGALGAFREGRFVKVAVLMGRLGARSLKWVERCSLIVALAYIGFLAWAGTRLTLTSYQTGAKSMITDMPLWIAQSTIAIGAAILGWHMVALIAKTITGRRNMTVEGVNATSVEVER